MIEPANTLEKCPLYDTGRLRGRIEVDTLLRFSSSYTYINMRNRQTSTPRYWNKHAEIMDVTITRVLLHSHNALVILWRFGAAKKARPIWRTAMSFRINNWHLLPVFEIHENLERNSRLAPVSGHLTSRVNVSAGKVPKFSRPYD